MSKLSKYAREVEKAFKEAREEYMKAFRAWEVAKANADFAEVKRYESEGEKREGIMRAQLELQRAEVDFQGVKIGGSWKVFEDKLRAIDTECRKAIAEEYSLKPEDIDENALKLIESGIATSDDMRRLADQFENNATMRRLIAKYAKEGADKANTKEEAEGLRVLAHQCGGEKADAIERWENFVGTARRLSGQSHEDNPSPRYVENISHQWEALVNTAEV